MKLEFRKEKSKSILVCTRDDGSSTWTQTDAFFIAHDLVHYAVETNLTFSKGFFGLIKGGMNVSDFQDKLKFRPHEMEMESLYAEHLVNLFLSEQNDGKYYSNFQYEFDQICKQVNLPQLVISNSHLDQIRSDIEYLLARWSSIQPEENLTLQLV